MIDAPDSAAVCATFDLGKPRGAMAAVAGGLTNRLFRLETARGTFAVKAMNRDPAFAGYDAWIERAFVVEMRAYDVGIDMPRPVPVAETGRCLAELPHESGEPWHLRVHEWVDATPLARVVHPPDTAARVGATIARVHALQIEAKATLAESLRMFGAEHWQALTERVERSDVAWAWHFRSCIPIVSELEGFVVNARSANDGEALILSHRDADQKNFMSTIDGRLILVDWDAVGPVAAQQEIASLALVWGGVDLGEPAPAAARALLDGYRLAGGTLNDVRAEDFGEFISTTLGWFEYNVRRALGDGSRDPSDRDMAPKIVLRHLDLLRRYARSIEGWTRMLNR